VPQEVLNARNIHKAYTLRWQIELIFKIWKSIGGIHKIKKMKIARFESYLYAKLLWLIVNWQIVWKINIFIHKASGKILSLFKAFKSLKNNINAFKQAIKSGKQQIEIFIETQLMFGEKHHILSKKKEKNSMYEIFLVM